MEGEYYLKFLGTYVQFGTDEKQRVIYRYVGITDATPFIWLHACIAQDYLKLAHDVHTVIASK